MCDAPLRVLWSSTDAGQLRMDGDADERTIATCEGRGISTGWGYW